jgi:homoserine O-acetyltransferase
MDNETPIDAGVGVVATQHCTLSLPEGGLVLDQGGRLARIDVAYETYGTLSPARDNVVFVCHALTGDAHVAGYHAGDEKPTGWWDGMIGPGRGIDTERFFVVCANILGGCKGTTGPSSPHPGDGRPYGSRFPEITVGDMVAVHRLLLLHLGITRLAAVVGGSFGGMQALEFAIRFPEMVERCICIAAAACLTPQALAFDIVGRASILQDPNWSNGDYYDGTGPNVGLAQARKLAHITYLSNEMLHEKFGRRVRQAPEETVAQFADAIRQPFEIESYLEHQGQKFIKRFDANSYLRITQAMDQYDLQARFGSLVAAFRGVTAKVLVVALSGDWLFLPEQSQDLTSAMLAGGRHVSYVCLEAPAGHDAFLTHIEKLTSVLGAFLTARTEPMAEDPDHPLTPEQRADYGRLLDLVPVGSRTLLDLGCGDGRLLNLICHQFRGIGGTGVDFDVDETIEVLHQGHNVLLTDIDKGLRLIPDDSHDCVVLSETLQVMKKPHEVLEQLLRIAPVGIISFPNFGHWLIRSRLFFGGRMPRSRRLPFAWFDTPNIHLCTLDDFLDLCKALHIHVERTTYLCSRWQSRLLTALGMPNLGASRVLVRVTRSPRPPAGG